MPLFAVLDLRSPIPAVLKGEAAGESDAEVVRRLGLASPVIIWLSVDELSAPPSAERKAMLRSCTCVVGPFVLEHAYATREWLNAGAQYALLAPAAGAMLNALPGEMRRIIAEEALPSERLLLLLTPAELEGEEADALMGAMAGLAAKSGSGCRECERSKTVGAVGGVPCDG